MIKITMLYYAVDLCSCQIISIVKSYTIRHIKFFLLRIDFICLTVFSYKHSVTFVGFSLLLFYFVICELPLIETKCTIFHPILCCLIIEIKHSRLVNEIIRQIKLNIMSVINEDIISCL